MYIYIYTYTKTDLWISDFVCFYFLGGNDNKTRSHSPGKTCATPARK